MAEALNFKEVAKQQRGEMQWPCNAGARVRLCHWVFAFPISILCLNYFFLNHVTFLCVCVGIGIAVAGLSNPVRFLWQWLRADASEMQETLRRSSFFLMEGS